MTNTLPPRAARRPAARLAATGTLALALGLAVLPGAAASAAVTDGAAAKPKASAPVANGPLLSYVVNTRANPGQSAKAARAVEAAGGTVVQTWAQIGVVVAQSAVPDFRSRVLATKGGGIDSVGATRTAAVITPPDSVPVPGRTPATLPAEGTAFDVAQLRADRAHALPGGKGSRDVLVAVLDSGVEDTHEDLAANFDAAGSASCIRGGRPTTTRAEWLPTSSDHGTHVAGTIAADDNGKGVVGVAPDVRISSVKVVDENGFIYPEYAICGFVWAAEHGADVTNSSYYIDPWMYWCDTDPDQAAAKEAVTRAVDYAAGRGVVNVAAAGNDYTDLANNTVDTTSPDDTTPVSRPLDASCVDMPAELPGVVTVSATTATRVKSSFSNYGLGVIDVAAPGSSIWSTTLGSTYGTKSGTSMASPHVAGVAALLKSTHPDATSAQVLALLRGQAQDQACGAPIVLTGRATQTCTGTTAYNSFFGDGIVDALAAVQR